MIYADSSFTASLYALDGNTAQANAIYQTDRRRPLIFTAWQELELGNTLRLMLHRAAKQGLGAPFQLANCQKRIHQDLAAGVLRRVDLDYGRCLGRASQLSRRYTEELGVVMLDVWQVASAIEVGATAFWTFDQDQEALARRCGDFDTVVGMGPV